MIVVFHLTVYFCYHIWDNYISTMLGVKSERANVNNQRPEGAHPKPTNQDPEAGKVDYDNPPLHGPSTSKSEALYSTFSDMSEDSVGEDDDKSLLLQRLEFEDRAVGYQSIYNVEPTFDAIHCEEQGLRFSPPVYMQRYMVIDNILKQPFHNESIKKVIDFGCAELSFEVRNLKKLFNIEEIIAVDLDEELLYSNKNKVSPTPTDYLAQRPSPLNIRVYCGSVGHTNEVLHKTDAVVAIELIEHLYPPDLECLPFTIFGFIRPKIAMLTTPNADFNVLFPDPTKFRHDDHKFEWSRQQFEEWCNNLVLRYPDYSVTFQGIGPGPAGTEQLGCCSQMATFVKLRESPLPGEEFQDLNVQNGPYKLIHECEYPFFCDTRTSEEKIRDEAVSFLTRCKLLSRMYQADSDEETNSKNKEIPLKVVMSKAKCFSMTKLRNILIKENWELRTDPKGCEFVLLPDSDNEDKGSSSRSDFNDDLDDCDSYQNNNMISWDVTALNEEENWDSDGKLDVDLTRKSTMENSTPVNSFCISEKHVPSLSNVHAKNDCDTPKVNKITTCTQSSVNNCCVEDSNLTETQFDSFTSGQKEYVQEDTSGDISIYETPYFNGCSVSKLQSNPQSTYYKSIEGGSLNSSIGCKKALSFDKSDVQNELSEPTWRETNNDIFCPPVSPLNSSTYATPCCSKIHKNHIPKCLSLQQINSNGGISSLHSEKKSTSKDDLVAKEQRENVSKSLEGLKNQESCELHDTFSYTSKVIDSGYPDSCHSEQDMDLDLTPEQFDDIETESEGNDSSSLPSPVAPVPPQFVRRVEEVENGDVANNNRDGEGNNVVVDMEEEPLEFLAQIEEIDHDVPNFAGVEKALQDLNEFNRGAESDSKENTGHQQGLHCEPQQAEPCVPTTSHSLPANETLTHQRESCIETDSNVESEESNEVENIKPNPSVMSIGSSWEHLDQLRKLNNCKQNSKTNNPSSYGLNSQNSLTTVIDGCSRFSDVSIVQPVEEDSISIISEQGLSPESSFPLWLLKIGYAAIESRTRQRKNTVSIRSVYQSASSLNSVTLLSDDYHDFPTWLLNMSQLMMEDENGVDTINSDISLWDVESVGDFEGQQEINEVFDVPVDARGGGDPINLRGRDSIWY